MTRHRWACNPQFPMSLFGLLNLNKPAGVTSRDVVDRVDRITAGAKAGHAGTLDPLATGVLVVCVGPATRLIEYVQRMPKCYTGTFLLGRRSDTEDVEGEVVELPDPPRPAVDEIRRAAASLTGTIEQRPPDYSALKIRGRRAYKLARQGKPVELKPRPVNVYGIEVADYDYPRLVLDIECGSGTYIRSLGRDLAESLGTAAVMSSLVRTAIGALRVEDAVSPEHLTDENVAQHLLPALRAVDALPRAQLTAKELTEIAHGRTITRDMPSDCGDVAATDASGRLVAILTRRAGWGFRPIRNFIAAG